MLVKESTLALADVVDLKQRLFKAEPERLHPSVRRRPPLKSPSLNSFMVKFNKNDTNLPFVIRYFNVAYFNRVENWLKTKYDIYEKGPDSYLISTLLALWELVYVSIITYVVYSDGAPSINGYLSRSHMSQIIEFFEFFDDVMAGKIDDKLGNPFTFDQLEADYIAAVYVKYSIYVKVATK